MGYVSKTLASGERIEYKASFHWIKWLCTIWTPWLLTTEIVVTNRRLIIKRGIIARRTEELSLNRIEEINLDQGILGRILSYGKVACHGTGSNVITTPTISSPMRFRVALQEAQSRLMGTDVQ